MDRQFDDPNAALDLAEARAGWSRERRRMTAEVDELREENAKLRTECKQVADLFDQEATKRIALGESFDKLESWADAQALCLLRLREWQKLAEGVIEAARAVSCNGDMTVRGPAVDRMAALSKAVGSLDADENRRGPWLVPPVPPKPQGPAVRLLREGEVPEKP